MPQHVWVAELRVSGRTAAKLASRHGLGAAEVREAVQCVAGLPFAWDDDPDRGRRAIVRVQIRRRWYLVVLYPTDHSLGDVWHLGSAYADDERRRRR